MTRSALSDVIDRAEKAEAEVIRLRAAVIDMRERAAVVAEAHLSKVSINEPLWHDGQDWAAESIALAIRALPVTGSVKPYRQIGNPGYVNDDGHEIQLHPIGGDQR